MSGNTGSTPLVRSRSSRARLIATRPPVFSWLLPAAPVTAMAAPTLPPGAAAASSSAWRKARRSTDGSCIPAQLGFTDQIIHSPQTRTGPTPALWNETLGH
eukprot:4726278-Prymnesium_polylepis.1